MTLKASLIRGALVGGAICLPLGVLAGIFLGNILYEADEAKAPMFFIVMVTGCFVAWGVFIGAMLKAQASDGRDE